MYSLDINFLKDRVAYQDSSKKKQRVKISLPIGDLTPLYIGVGIAVALPVLVGAGWWILQAKNTELEQTIAQLEQEKQSLEAQIGSINKIKEETNRIKQETQALITVFDQIRPWSAMLQDLRDRIPLSVQIENIRQTPPVAAVEGQSPPNPAGGVEMVGLARSFNDVNDFILTLQQSRFLKATETRIVTAESVDAPLPSGIVLPPGFKPPQMVKYTIQSSMSDVPASELIRELEQKGTVGLVSRIRNLQKNRSPSKMTLSEDLNLEQGEDFDAATPSYPVIFGVSLTPQISGIIIGVLGIAGALFMAMNMLMPAWDAFQQQQTKQTEIQGEIEQKKTAIRQISKIQEEQTLAKQQQVQVLGLFANEKTLDTILIDLNRLVESGNSQVPLNGVRAKLKKYVPASGKAEPITDSSLGLLVNGKLKRSSIAIEIVGTYEQTQSILRNIERLQPLLIVKDYQSVLAPETAVEPGKGMRRIGPAPISTNFQLQALMPMSPEEAVKK